jgi:hypothetical protein
MEGGGGEIGEMRYRKEYREEKKRKNKIVKKMSTVMYYTPLHNTIQQNTLLHNTALHSSPLLSIHYTTLLYTALHYTPYTALHSTHFVPIEGILTQGPCEGYVELWHVAQQRLSTHLEKEGWKGR